MVFAACMLGVSIGIGGVVLYRFLRRWLQHVSDTPSLHENVEHTCDSTSNDKMPGDCESTETMV